MQNSQHDTPALVDFVDLAALQQTPGISDAFPTLLSLRWAIRKHRAMFIERGVMIEVAGRLRFHPQLFQQAVVDIGRITVAGSRQS